MSLGSDKPTVRLLNMHVRDKVAPKWFELGMQLLSSKQSEKLNIIRQDHPADTNTCCTEMFRHWLDVDTEASWNKLIAALEQIGYNALAEIIRINVLKGSFIEHLVYCSVVALYHSLQNFQSTQISYIH